CASARGQRMRSMPAATACQIRRLQSDDVHQLLELIKAVRREFGLTNRAVELLEPSDYAVLDVYRNRRSAYFVAVEGRQVLGGSGIFPLAEADWGTCELQRMYLRAEYRGYGIGQSLLDTCIDHAQSLGFERCYAETVAEMSTAIGFY